MVSILKCIGKAPESGVRNDRTRIWRNDPNIQLGEVVDAACIRTDKRRSEYGTTLIEVLPKTPMDMLGCRLPLLIQATPSIYREWLFRRENRASRLLQARSRGLSPLCNLSRTTRLASSRERRRRSESQPLRTP